MMKKNAILIGMTVAMCSLGAAAQVKINDVSSADLAKLKTCFAEKGALRTDVMNTVSNAYKAKIIKSDIQSNYLYQIQAQDDLEKSTQAAFRKGVEMTSLDTCNKWKNVYSALLASAKKDVGFYTPKTPTTAQSPSPAPATPVANNPSIGIIAAEATPVASSSGCNVKLKIASMSPGQQITARWGAAPNNPTVTIFSNMNQTSTGAIDWTGAIPGMSSWDASSIILNASTKSGGAISLAACKPTTPPPASNANLAVDGGSFTLSNTQMIRYGKDSTWIAKSFNAGTHVCLPSSFDGRDPVPGVQKSCQVAPSGTVATVNPNSANLAVDGGSFNLSATQTIRYGKDATWISKSFNAGRHVCLPSSFDGRDPVPGVQKSCQVAP
jgi:hypothetical protein